MKYINQDMMSDRVMSNEMDEGLRNDITECPDGSMVYETMLITLEYPKDLLMFGYLSEEECLQCFRQLRRNHEHWIKCEPKFVAIYEFMGDDVHPKVQKIEVWHSIGN